MRDETFFSSHIYFLTLWKIDINVINIKHVKGFLWLLIPEVVGKILWMLSTVQYVSEQNIVQQCT